MADFVAFARSRIGREKLAEIILGNSSGLVVQDKEGRLTLGYVDYEVEEFGGRDYECWYLLDEENSARLKNALESIDEGDLFDKCVKAFTIKFSNNQFENFCQTYGIAFKKSTY